MGWMDCYTFRSVCVLWGRCMCGYYSTLFFTWPFPCNMGLGAAGGYRTWMG